MTAFAEIRMLVGLALAGVIGYYLWTPLVVLAPAAIAAIWVMRVISSRRSPR